MEVQFLLSLSSVRAVRAFEVVRNSLAGFWKGERVNRNPATFLGGLLSFGKFVVPLLIPFVDFVLHGHEVYLYSWFLTCGRPPPFIKRV